VNLIARHHGLKKAQEKTTYVFDGRTSPKLKQSVAWCVCLHSSNNINQLSSFGRVHASN